MRRARRGRRSLVAAAVAAAALAGLAVGVVVQVDRWADVRSDERLADEAVRFATSAVEDLTTITPDDATSVFDRLAEESSGDFRTKVVALAEPIVAAVVEADVASRGTVTSAGVESIDSSDASLLVAATVKLDGAPDGTGYRLRVDLRRDGSRWTLADLALVS